MKLHTRNTGRKWCHILYGDTSLFWPERRTIVFTNEPLEGCTHAAVRWCAAKKVRSFVRSFLNESAETRRDPINRAAKRCR